MSSVRMHAARFDTALQALQLYTSWWKGWTPVRLGEWRGQDEVIWRRGPLSDLPALVRFLDEEYSDEVLLGLPRRRKGDSGIGRTSVLWCKVEGTDQLARARKLRPLPSLVLQEGSSSRRWLIWALEQTVTYFDAVAHNRKIAYHLGAKQKHGDPEVAWFPAPGTCLRVGRSRPVPVVCSRLTTATYTALEVTGRLREPPAKDAWLEGIAR